MIALGAALAYSGFTALCLTLERHHEQVFHRRAIPPARRRFLTAAGWLFLGASLLPVVRSFGWGPGLVLWTGLLTAAAMPLAMLLTYAPRLALGLAAVSVPLGLVLLLSGG